MGAMSPLIRFFTMIRPCLATVAKRARFWPFVVGVSRERKGMQRIVASERKRNGTEVNSKRNVTEPNGKRFFCSSSLYPRRQNIFP